jgi:release factor glutamine methyltransferase
MRLLAPGGYLVLEIGQGQANDVMRLLTAAELVPVGEPRRDLAGIARVLAARAPVSPR